MPVSFVRQYQMAEHTMNIGSGKTLIMGILNVTPDSFSDGGRYARRDAALKHALQMVAEGADIIDIGAESTRPYAGAVKVSAEEELERLLPVLERLVKEVPRPISVDTYKGAVAREALKAGAHMINDVWGLQWDDEMARCVAAYGVPVVVMHNRLHADDNTDIMADILAFLRQSLAIATAAGIECSKLIVDPGIGFGKTTRQNLTVMRRLEELRELKCPILLGTSRKRFIGEVLDVPVEERVEGTAATVALGIAKRAAHIVRVHDVREISRVARMMDAMLEGE